MQRSRAVAVLAAACLTVAACGGGEDEEGGATERASTATTPDRPTAVEGSGPTGEGQAADRPGIQVYFTAGEQFMAVEREIELSDAGNVADPGESELAVRGIVELLLRGPTGEEASGDVPVATQIPVGTELEDVEVAGETATIDVSPEFLADISADPADRTREQESELNARVGQVAYSVSQVKDVKETKVVAGGIPVELDAAGVANGGADAPPKARVARADYAAPPSGPKPVSRPRGPKLPGTRQVQKKLAKLGFLPKRAIDGQAGYWTEQAVIAFQAWNGLVRDGVVGPATSAALKTARRPKPRSRGPAHRIEVHRDRGVALLVEAGRTKRAVHVSTGAPGTETPAGTYEVFRKELRSWSVPFQTWLPYASYFNQGIAFHEYAEVPPYPASHGCVRVPAPEAKGVYGFASLGTTVVVH